MKTVLRNIFLASLSGVLTFLAFPPFEFAPLAWVCLVPLLLAIKGCTLKRAFLYSCLTGVIFFSLLLYWLANVSVPGLIILVIVLSALYGLFGIVAGLVMKYGLDLFILPFAWVAFEYVRSNIFSGFPWGLLGYSQYRVINLIQIADITGAYGVSFLIATFNVAVFSAFIRSRKKTAYMMIALFLIIAATSYSIYRFDNYRIWGSPRLSVVQGNIPQNEKWDTKFAEDIIKKYTRLTEEAAKTAPALIVWPETSYPYLVEGKERSAEEVSSLASREGIPILAGFAYREGDNNYNAAMLFDEKGNLSNVYYKRHLVPFGEYVPFSKYLSFLRRYIDKTIGDFARGDAYTLFSLKSVTTTPSPSGTRLRETHFYNFGVLICFEDIFPYIMREFVLDGASFMINITNDAWFGDTAASLQHLQASVFRAVENRTPVIRAANTGISCFVNSTGKVSSCVEAGGKKNFVEGFATDRVDIYAGKSFYTVYGDVFVYFCAFMMIFLFITEKLFMIKGKKKSP